MNSITAVILTFNESIHLQRCIESIFPLTKNIVVVDSFSTDDTVDIARRCGATILQRAWQNNHSVQFNWALSQLPASTEWVFRIDADEILTTALIDEIKQTLRTINSSIVGLQCIRKMVFQGSLLKHGGMGGMLTLRLFRFGHGRSESRWMDEHIKLDGQSLNLSGAIIDNNLQSLEWWLAKHENYAKREAVDLLNLKYHFSVSDSVASQAVVSQLSLKRKIKEKIYARLPKGLRSIAYFMYRYILLGGFLDDANGRSFHRLQGYWYRNLADRNVAQVERYKQERGVDIKTAITHVLGISV